MPVSFVVCMHLACYLCFMPLAPWLVKGAHTQIPWASIGFHSFHSILLITAQLFPSFNHCCEATHYHINRTNHQAESKQVVERSNYLSRAATWI